MPKITNKRKSAGFVRLDRSLLRDTRLKSNHKILYALFCSMSETMESVFPSYAWIAKEIGYEYTGKAKPGSEEYERALSKFISSNLEPIINLGWIKKINNNGESCEYEVYDHDCNPEQKSTHPLNKKVQGNPEQKSTPSNKDSFSNNNLDKEPLSKKSKIKFKDPVEYLKTLNHENEELLIKWLEMRKEIKKPATIMAVDLAVKNLKPYSLEVQKKMIENSIMANWTGIFELKSNYNNNQPTPQKPQTKLNHLDLINT